ncbi:MAG TPA: carboxypeptidase-like regulatory domain-containing protein, partial [Pirellulales bacterium]|nr:carboxypeptidase-like regulatory domain-containing protein [Pirellulales bacterium]
GRFELRVSPDELPETYHPASLIALKRGYGLAWLDVKRDEPPGGVTLQLVEDHPIRGRVTDTEGRAVAGARVAVNAVLGSGTRSVDGFLNAWKNNWNSSFGKLDAHLYGRLATLLGAVSDAQGRFELSGLGVERVFRLEITADGYMTCGPHVINRERFDPTDYNRAALAQESAMMRKLRQTPFLAGPRFDYVAETELVVRGIVFTGAAREPVAEAEVSAGIDWGHSVSTKTDDKGHFALHGLSRDRSTLVHIAPPPSSALLFRTMPVNAASRENADNLDVELKRGVVVSGKVFDKTNGRTLRSGVRFVPLPGNAFADQPGYDGFQRDRTSRPTEKGNFRLVVIPGPGVLMAQVHGDGPPINERKIKQYRTASLTREDRERVAPREDDDGVVFTTAYNSIEFLSIENAAKVIDAPLDAKELTCDLPADPGKTVQIAIEDEQGGPLPGVFVAGVTESWPTTYRIDEPTCTIYALGADRPRRLCLLHPERHLAGGVTLTGDEHEIVTVRLGAAASITGRAVDESGAPVADALVQINYARAIARELDRFATLEQPPLKTDADGRFEVGDIVPGERFVLDFKQDDHYFRANLSDDQRTLQAGQKLELGEIKSRQLR